MIKIEIDGKELEVKPGSMVIEAADDANIHIPRFCYHKKLSIAANCRMCLVEVAKAPKPLPACATPVSEGMVVKTQSPIALMAQRSVMEFLLINHPLDCPICDQGGECELQDVSMGYGKDLSRFNRGKRSVKDENIGPLIATGMTRCIHCTRCVRFGEEIAGLRELGAVGRGENLEIRSFINNSVDSELSGNMIDVCPVGALTSKPYRFSARTWELQQRPSIAPHDAVGSNINVHSLRNNLKRVVPKENESINEVWLSDRDRFSYEGLKHEERLLNPLARINGQLQEVDWETALSQAVEIITQQVKTNPQDLIALLSPNCTVEEGYLAQKILNKLGSHKIDFRLKNNSKFAAINNTDNNLINLTEIEKADSIFLFGGSPRKSMPMLNHRIRKASLNGARVHAINPVSYDWNYNITTDYIVSADAMLNELTALVKYIAEYKEPITEPDSKNTDYNKAHGIAYNLKNSTNAYIIVGELAIEHPDYDKFYELLLALKQLTNSKIAILTEGANSQGLYYALNANNNKNSVSAEPVLAQVDKLSDAATYLLFNIEPEYDCADGYNFIQKLKTASNVISFSPFISDVIHEYATLVLPMAPFTETSGTFVNIEGVWQSFSAALSAQQGSTVRPLWRILCALAKLLDLPQQDFTYESSLDVKQEVYDLFNQNKDKLTRQQSEVAINKLQNSQSSITADKASVLLIAETNCYRTDNIVRRAESLQQTTDANHGKYLYMSTGLAQKLHLDGNESTVSLATVDNLKHQIVLPIIIDHKLPENSVYLTTGHDATLAINKPYSYIVINKQQ